MFGVKERADSLTPLTLPRQGDDFPRYGAPWRGKVKGNQNLFSFSIDSYKQKTKMVIYLKRVKGPAFCLTPNKLLV